MRAIITGSEGFIGQHLTAELEQAGHTVVGFDVKHDPFIEDVAKEDVVREALDAHRPDVVIHLAAKVGRLFGEDNVSETILDNAGMTACVAKVCGEEGVKLAYASTSEIYGDGGTNKNWNEDHFPLHNQWRPHAFLPHNIYGLSKRWGEEACRLYAPDDLVVLRFSMPYGPGLPAGRGRAAIINFLYDALWDRPLHVHKNSERSWCWIKDTVRAVRIILEEDQSGAFNIGRDDNACTMRKVAEMACDLVGTSRDRIEEIDAPERQTVVKRLDTGKIRDLGWAPTVELAEGMAKTLEFVKTLPHPDYVAA